MVFLKDFSEERCVESSAVSAYIRRHPELFKGHTKKVGQKMKLDDTAIEILAKQYPLPKPIEVIEDTESRQKLLQAQGFIIQLQQQITELQAKAILAETQTLLLEEKQNRIDELKAENERLKNRKLWDRIFNKSG